jgi:hypothetical protein
MQPSAADGSETERTKFRADKIPVHTDSKSRNTHIQEGKEESAVNGAEWGLQRRRSHRKSLVDRIQHIVRTSIDVQATIVEEPEEDEKSERVDAIAAGDSGQP